MGKRFGGKLHGISLESFLQMAKMESITCTLFVKIEYEQGCLYLLDGELISAETDELIDVDAAHRILSWENPSIEIKNSCTKTENTINQSLMNLLMQVAQLKDEGKLKPRTKPRPKTPPATEFNDRLDTPQPDESKANTKDHIPEKTITSQSPAPPIEKRRKLNPIILGLVILGIAGVGIGTYLISDQNPNTSYQTLLSELSDAQTPEQKIDLLNAFLNASQGGPNAEKARQQRDSLKKKIISQNYKQLIITAERHIKNGDFESAIAAYNAFQKMHPGNEYSQIIAAKTKEWVTQSESRDFEAMRQHTETQGPERIERYVAFLKKHPNTKHRFKLTRQIAELEAPYYRYLETQLLAMKESGNWQDALTLCHHFLEAYPNSEYGDVIKQFQAVCEEKIRGGKAFDALVQKADTYGTDWESARAVFSDFLKNNPRSPAAEEIKAKITQLTEQMDADRRSKARERMTAHLSALSPRFTIDETGETVRDKKTRLTWAILDSQMDLNQCLTYKDAQSYVAQLTTGGYKDWRLPSPKELSKLYSKKSSFPHAPDQWYWTSKSTKSYADKWDLDVVVILPDSAKGPVQIEKKYWECGTVRAVRSSKK